MLTNTASSPCITPPRPVQYMSVNAATNISSVLSDIVSTTVKMSTMRLCSTCNAIDIRSMLEEAISAIDFNQSTYNPRRFKREIEPLTLHDTVDILEERKDTCNFCALLWEEWQRQKEMRWKEFKDNKTCVSLPSITFKISKIWASRGREETHPHVEINYKTAEKESNFFLEISTNRTIFESEGPKDPSKDYLLLKEIYPNTDGHQGLNLAAQWFNECLSDHPSCLRASEKVFAFPTRLIEVGDDTKNPHLYVPCRNGLGPTHGAWVSLSYCWGGNSKFILTKDTLPSLLTGIPLKDFPKTLQDAILITRALGLKYLWIDALCILQDSLDDWQQESPKMSEIYANAILTIIAATTPSVTTGIFLARKSKLTCQLPWRQPRPTDTRSAYIGSTSKYEETSVGLRMRSPSIYTIPNRITWASRAWTFQECVLSWRTLHYYPDQMAWSCIECTTLENGVTLAETHHQKTTDQRKFQLYRKKLAMTRSESQNKAPLSMGEKYQHWYRTVEQYSQRSLTNESDRLPAIGGLALSIAEEMQDTYHAGLWEKDFICGLAWQLNLQSPDKLNLSTGLLSWNWTISCTDVFFGFGRDLKFQYTYLACVEEIDIEYKSSTYGEVKSGRLVLSGPCQSYHIRLVDQKWEASTAQDGQQDHLLAFNRFLNNTLTTNLEMKTRLAENDGAEARDYVILQLLFGLSKWCGKKMALLLLERLDTHMLPASAGGFDGKCYRRVGLLPLYIYTDDKVAISKELEDNPWPVERVTIF